MAKAVAVADEQNTGAGSGIIPWIKAQPHRLSEFMKDVRAEMRKVISPSKQEVISTTTVVLVTVFLFAAYFELVDSAIGQGVTRLIQHFTQK